MKKYIKTIAHTLYHKWLVFKECWKYGIPWRGIMHDMSKFGLTELIAYAPLFDYYKTPVAKTYAEVENDLPAAEWHKIQIARLGHLHKNKHHWQHWLLSEDHTPIAPVKIPRPYLLEMMADWKAKSISRKVETTEWIRMNANIIIHETSKKEIEDILGRKIWT